MIDPSKQKQFCELCVRSTVLSSFIKKKMASQYLRLKTISVFSKAFSCRRSLLLLSAWIWLWIYQPNSFTKTHQNHKRTSATQSEDTISFKYVNSTHLIFQWAKNKNNIQAMKFRCLLRSKSVQSFRLLDSH